MMPRLHEPSRERPARRVSPQPGDGNDGEIVGAIALDD
jgi:hypothetical protein